MKPVSQHMHIGIAPFYELTIVPDIAIQLIKWNACHDMPLFAVVTGGNRSYQNSYHYGPDEKYVNRPDLYFDSGFYKAP